MLLIDLGNSRAKVALSNATEAFASIENRALSAEAILAASPGNTEVTDVVICSVRDEALNQDLVTELRRHGLNVKLLNWSDVEPHLNTSYDSRQSLGLDRQVAMLGAMSYGRGAALVLDLGTASTIDAVDATGIHLGGVIFPGLNLQREALLSGTDDIAVGEQLNEAITFPLSTSEAVFSGTLQAWRGGVWAIHAAMAAAMPDEVTTYLTGGQAPLLELANNDSISSARDLQVVPDLVLKGIRFFGREYTMRKLLLGLVLANLLYFLYARFTEPEKEPIIVYRGEKGVPLLVTLDELDRPPAVTSHVPIDVDARAIRNKGSVTGITTVEPVVAISNSGSTVESPKISDVSPEPVPSKPALAPVTAACQTIGPFGDLAVAKASRLSLERADIDVKNRKETRKITGAYWVYLPAYENKDQARAASKLLADNGIKDYFIISDEENRNGISLGLYNKKSGSERRRSDIAKLGFEPLIARKERQRDYWWLDIAPKEPLKESVWRVDGMAKETSLSARKCEA